MAQHPPIRRGAVFDASGQYRYRLWRRWSAGPRIAFVMLNPSTADHRVDDPTIRRCMDFARRWGYGALEVVNLFAYRTPSPRELARARAPVGPDNDRHLRAARRRCAAVIAAWGAHGALHGRDQDALRLLDAPLLCLGVTRGGHPRHPLYLRSTLQPTPFLGPATLSPS